MVRHWKSAAVAAALVVLPGASGVVFGEALIPPYKVPDYQAICTVGIQKLDTGIEVIGAPPAKIQAARASSEAAKKQMAASNWYPCAQSVQKGLDALSAG